MTDDTDEKQRLDLAEKVMASLTPHEAQLLRQRLNGGQSLEEVGRQFQVTRERIRQIEAKARRKLEDD